MKRSFCCLFVSLFLPAIGLLPTTGFAAPAWPALKSVIERQMSDQDLRPAKLASAIPLEIRDAAWVIGVESGLAQHCRIEWRTERIAPMMSIARQSGQFDKVQLKALRTWANVAQRNTLKAVTALGSCTPELQDWLAGRGLRTKSTEPISG